tara:strand:+ start:1273 stop:1674 length:402 start_codon:yes stop_codon:yes gene_type:complete
VKADELIVFWACSLVYVLSALAYGDLADCDSSTHVMSDIERKVCQKREDFSTRLQAQFKSFQMPNTSNYSNHAQQGLQKQVDKNDFFSRDNTGIVRAFKPLKQPVEMSQPATEHNTQAVSEPERITYPIMNFF